MPPTTVRHGHYKMMGGICLSVCLSVCLSRASTQLDNGKAYEDKKIGRMEAYRTCKPVNQEVKGQDHHFC